MDQDVTLTTLQRETTCGQGSISTEAGQHTVPPTDSQPVESTPESAIQSAQEYEETEYTQMLERIARDLKTPKSSYMEICRGTRIKRDSTADTQIRTQLNIPKAEKIYMMIDDGIKTPYKIGLAMCGTGIYVRNKKEQVYIRWEDLKRSDLSKNLIGTVAIRGIAISVTDDDNLLNILCTMCEIGQKDMVHSEFKLSPKENEIPNFCTECGNKLQQGDVFCPMCGAKVK